MNIPKYWARSNPVPPGRGGLPVPVTSWQWSNLSLEDARKKAADRDAELNRAFTAGESLNQYSYSDRPLREEIVQTLPGDTGEPAALVTRNLYGSLVLNTAAVMFIDVDFPSPAKPWKSGLFRRPFSKKPSADENVQRLLFEIREWAAQRSSIGLRTYRTFAGLRCLVTNQTFDPTDRKSTELLQSIGSDPLYVRLCKAQSCFRARLTPKPWRCGIGKPPARFPWTTNEQESRYRQWQSGYDRAIKGYGVCRLLEQTGTADVHPSVQPILALHDQFVLAPTDIPLA